MLVTNHMMYLQDEIRTYPYFKTENCGIVKREFVVEAMKI